MITKQQLRLAALVAGALAAAPAAAQTRQLLNYEQIHKPLVADGGAMVVSQSTQASEAGAQVLREGGNAVDAAVTMAFVMAVTLPRAGNIGGDGYMLIHLADGQRAVAIDYRSMAPALATSGMAILRYRVPHYRCLHLGHPRNKREPPGILGWPAVHLEISLPHFAS